MSFAPEPINQLAARWKAALREPFVAEDVLAGRADGPAFSPKQVFDHECGLRLIVAVEIFPNNAWVLPISIRAMAGNAAGFAARGGIETDAWERWGHAYYRAVSRCDKPIVFEGPSPTKKTLFWHRLLAGSMPTAEQMIGWGFK